MEHKPDFTDVGTFLLNIGRRLEKEGAALQAMADQWFEDRGTDENAILCTYGVEVARLVRTLLLVTDQLCQDCKIKRLSETVIFPDISA